MGINFIRKRSGEKVEFSLEKVAKAIYKGMLSQNLDSISEAEKIAKKVDVKLEQKRIENPEYLPDVEEIQDIVEEELMSSGYLAVAKAYILYREEKAKERQKSIFKPRINLKPYEYPELIQYVEAIRNSYRIHTEFNYTGDVQDFKVLTNHEERNAMKNAMLAIAQIEVAVKTFWGDIFKKMPKPEVGAVGFTFAESEVRHADAYSHLLEILGLNYEFENIKNIPVLMERVNYLQDALKNAKSQDNSEYSKSVMLFSIFIEHVSLFSQFLIIMSFNKFQNRFKGISNAVEATSKEEQIHGLFGIELIKIIRSENPSWFGKENEEFVKTSCLQAFESEVKVIDWIFEAGELPFLPKKVIYEFLKNRFNNSLNSLGVEKIFEIDEKLLSETEWFEDEIMATKHGDFFYKRPINYNKKSLSITGDDLF